MDGEVNNQAVRIAQDAKRDAGDRQTQQTQTDNTRRTTGDGRTRWTHRMDVLDGRPGTFKGVNRDKEG